MREDLTLTAGGPHGSPGPPEHDLPAGGRPKENQEELSAHPRQEKESISTLSFPELSGRSPLLEKAWG